MLDAILAKRNIPDVCRFRDGSPVTAENVKERQAECREIMLSEVYGRMPGAPSYVKGEVISEGRPRFGVSVLRSCRRIFQIFRRIGLCMP